MNPLAADIFSRMQHIANRAQFNTYERCRSQEFEQRDIRVKKDAQREMVLKWFEELHESSETMRILSLPDEHWSFESFVADRRKECSFCGVQWDWLTLERSIPFIPDNRAVKYDIGYASIPAVNGGIQCYVKGFNVAVHMRVGHLASIVKKDLPVSSRKVFKRFCRSNTAVWLDFNGPLSDEVRLACWRLQYLLDKTKPEVPVVISFMAARDDYDDDDRRVEICVSWLNSERWRINQFILHRIERNQTASCPYLSVIGSVYPSLENPKESDREG
jgi:hypothetical protein